MAEGLVQIDDEFDPDRCQTIVGGHGAGQCKYKAVLGFKYCQIHETGNHAVRTSQNKQVIRNYNLAKWKSHLESKLKDSDAVMSLRDEIGILRVLIEERLNNCQDTTDLLLNSSVIADLISRVERVVVACQKIEEKRSGLLDKGKAIQLAGEIVKVISGFVSDDEVLGAIATKIGEAVTRVAADKSE
jgi:hypothetical protein